ncbi:MAG: M20 family metallo-hydrolase [Rhodospirillales bacterium]|nr:M20 family metallo-hydrolase [Rhodospirillales bacterium]MBO6787192.1 M20 family metallo-hydrolase [Rhodospirillales bacterium]
MTLAEIGATPRGGVRRIALTDEDKRARDLFCDWARDAGCDIRVDTIGNIFARRPGRNPDALPVATGSHIDSQPLGGKFDGAFGVMAGLEVIRALNDAGIETEAPIEVVDWTDEEGARFAAGCIGSGVYSGHRDLAAALVLEDAEGVTVGAALERIGYAGPAPLGEPGFGAYFEAHIEQGPILEAEGLTVGAVLGAQGQRCFVVTVEGVDGHAGTLPMAKRQDSFVGTAKMTVALTELAETYNPAAVITIGHVRVVPNSRNTVPGKTVFTIDSRHPDSETLERMEADMIRICGEIAKSSGLSVAFETVTRAEPIVFNTGCVDAVREACRQRQIRFMDIHSGAGHDACKIAAVSPAGMIFVPCIDGISHNELEDARAEDLAVGTQVLLDSMLAYAK